MSYELFQQGPAVYIPILLLSLIITVVAYGSFPLIFAKARKSPITKKKYRGLCYGINVAVMFLFIVMNGGASSGAPYFLWTWVFSSWGVRILDDKALLTDGTHNPNTTTFEIEQSNLVAEADKICFCRKCGEKLIENSQLCRKCGVGIEILPITEPDVTKPIGTELSQAQTTTRITVSKKNKKTPIIISVISAVAICLIAVIIVVLVGNNNKQPSQGEQITYNVGIRTITFSDKFTAEYALASWENGEKTEQSMIAIMDKYGSEQGGGQLYIITPGEFVDEIDEWCFSEKRKQGDYAIIENLYGFSLCYFSGENIEDDGITNNKDNQIPL